MDPLILVAAGLANGSYYVLMALGLVLIYKAQDMVQFAHGEVFMVGAFTGFVVYAVFDLPYLLAFLVAVALGAVLGMAIERIAIRPIANMPHMTLVMVTVGLSFLLKGAARTEFGKDIYTFPPVFEGGPIVIGGTIVLPQHLLIITVSIFLTLALYLMFRVTALGKQMRATAQNMTGAMLSGINIGRVFSATWAMAAGMGAAGGVLAAPAISLLYPDVGSNILLKGFAAAVLGGFGSIPGAIVGGYLVGLIEKLFGFYVSTAFEHLSAFLIIMVVLIVWPKGLFGAREIKRV